MSPEALQKSIAETLPGLFECSRAPQGGYRVRTPLVYPDGGIIDVFVMDRHGDYRVTDLGETLGWLRMQSVDAGRTAEQTRIIEDTCQTLGVNLHQGQLLLRVETESSIAEAVLRIGQAAARISDLLLGEVMLVRTAAPSARK